MDEVLAYTQELKDIDAEFVNPFLSALHGTLSSLGKQQAQKGRPSLVRVESYSEDTMILIEINGQLHGGVILAMDEETTKRIASSLLRGVPVDTLDDMVKSSLDEFSLRISEKAKKQLIKNGMLANVAYKVNYCKSLTFAGSTPFLRVPFSTDQGELDVLVNLKKVN